MYIFFLVIIAVFIGVLMVISMILPKTTIITAEAVIEAPREKVFNYIRIIRNQEKYSKWVMTDPNVKIVYTGTDGTLGFTSSWTSDVNSVGAGAQEIIKIYEGAGYEVEIRFERPMKGISYAKYMTEVIDANRTKVTTTFSSSAPIPMNLLSSIFKKMLQKDMDQNLANLKAILEN